MTLRDLCEALESGRLNDDWVDLVDYSLRTIIEKAYADLLERTQLVIMALENPILVSLIPPEQNIPIRLYESLAAILVRMGLTVHEVETIDARLALTLLHHAFDRQNSPSGTSAAARESA